MAGVKPRFVQWDGNGSPTEWVISQNLFRRHLTSSQRAAVAYQLLPMLETEAKQRQRLSSGRGKKVGKNRPTFSSNGKAAEVAARLTKTNENYVKAIKAVGVTAPELIEEIRSGELKVPDAVTLAKLPKARRTKVMRMVKEAAPDQTLKRLIRVAELDSLKRSSHRKAPPSTKGNIQLWCGDCLSLMSKRIAAKTISLVVTSPPFNVGVTYNRYHDNRPFDEYLEWLTKVFQEIKRVLRDDGSFFLNLGSSRKRPWNAMRVAEAAGKFFTLQNEIVWVKAISIDGRFHGHCNPIRGRRFLNHQWESVFHFTKSGGVPLDRLAVGVPYEDETNLLRNSSPGNIRCGGDVWFIPYETVHGDGEKGLHPAVFPVELAARCIRLAGVQNGTKVLDPFAGIGSTLTACRELGVKGIGIEIDAGYCRHATTKLAVK